MVLLPEKSIVHDLLTLPSCPIDESTQMPRTDILTITHKNPNAAGIKVTLGMPEPTEVSVTLCSEQKNYQFSFDVHNITSGESVHYIPREDIIPESYRVYIHLNNTNYQTNSLFINKINKR